MDGTFVNGEKSKLFPIFIIGAILMSFPLFMLHLKNETEEIRREYNLSSSESSKSYSSMSKMDRNAYICSQKVVEDNLKHPKTAKFSKSYETYVTDLGDNNYRIVGWVETENDFGVDVKYTYVVTLTMVNGGDGYTDGYCSFVD